MINQNRALSVRMMCVCFFCSPRTMRDSTHRSDCESALDSAWRVDSRRKSGAPQKMRKGWNMGSIQTDQDMRKRQAKSSEFFWSWLNNSHGNQSFFCLPHKRPCSLVKMRNWWSFEVSVSHFWINTWCTKYFFVSTFGWWERGVPVCTAIHG